MDIVVSTGHASLLIVQVLIGSFVQRVWIENLIYMSLCI